MRLFNLAVVLGLVNVNVRPLSRFGSPASDLPVGLFSSLAFVASTPSLFLGRGVHAPTDYQFGVGADDGF